jgi:SLT domain-containing protein
MHLRMVCIKGIEGVIQGTMSVKEAFKSMAQSILVSLAQVLAKMMAMKVMTAMFGVTTNGRRRNYSNGKRRNNTGYRNGGIATEPTYLVGEGKHNEAVVPLPDGRSIPVNMKGAGGT